MDIRFSHLPARTRELIQRIAQVAIKHNAPAYLVGGFVRDLILRRPNEDVDIVIEGDALALARAVATQLKARPLLHQRFKTAHLELAGGLHLDLATARREIYPFPGSLPVITPGLIREDLFRRDFTINAMALRVLNQSQGELVDPYGGYQDLQQGILRVLHPQSFRDDPTRIIRGIRFEQRFNFRFDPRTRRLLKAALQQQASGTVKPARYFEAFRKTLTEPCPGRCLGRMQELGAFDFLQKDFSLDRSLARKMDQATLALRRRKEYERSPWSLVYLLVSLANVKARAVVGIAQRFQISRREKDTVLAKEHFPEILRQLQNPQLKPSQVYVILNPLPEAAVFFLRARLGGRPAARKVEQYLLKARQVKTFLNGEDLRALGFPEGPLIGKVLTNLFLNKLDGRLKTRAQEIRAAQKFLALGT